MSDFADFLFGTAKLMSDELKRDAQVDVLMRRAFKELANERNGGSVAGTAGRTAGLVDGLPTVDRGDGK